MSEIEILNMENDISSKVKTQINRTRRNTTCVSRCGQSRRNWVPTKTSKTKPSSGEQLRNSISGKDDEKDRKGDQQILQDAALFRRRHRDKDYIETILALPWNKRKRDGRSTY